MRSCALVLMLLTPAVAQAQVPPDGDWWTLETEHFRVTYESGLEALARHAAARAEVAHARYSAELTEAPAGTIDIIVSDHADYANGLATPFPSNRIVIFAHPPVDHLSLSYTRDWVDLVVVHELAHVFHLDQAGWLGSALRHVFGRLPWPWPAFPTIGTPQWSIEGLATYLESRFTGMGRVEGSIHEMIVRTAVLRGEFERIDEASGFSPEWPSGLRAYAYGSLFLDYIGRVHGPDAAARLVEETATALLPPPIAFDNVASDALGSSFSDVWDAWHHDLEGRYAALADSLRGVGLTESDRLSEPGRWALYPRVDPRGGRVAFVASDGRADPATRVLDPETGAVHTIARRNQGAGLFGPASWLPAGGGLVTAQFERHGPYRLYEDLYQVDENGDERRLTDGLRLGEPSVAPDGRRVVAVQSDDGAMRIVLYDLRTGALRALTDYRPDTGWALPRWSPDGTRIAVGRWRRGGTFDIVVLDTLGTVVLEPTRDRATNAAPAWSPDGRYLLFWSDRSGIPNLYAFDLDSRTAAAARPGRFLAAARTGSVAPRGPDRQERAPRLYQVTNVLTGAFYPDISPDGRWIYFSKYDADGYHIERMPFDPATWRETAVAPNGSGDPVGEARLLAAVGPAASADAAPTVLPPTRDSTRDSTSDSAGASTAEPTAAPPADSTASSVADAASDATPDATSTDTIAGPSRRYSPWHSLLPRYWAPLVIREGTAGTFYGAQTGGHDLVGRHSYGLTVAVDPGAWRAEGQLGYAYAGLGNPVLGLEASREWDFIGWAALQGGARDGQTATVLSREDVARVSTTLLRSRWRSRSALTLGAEYVREHLVLADAPGYAFPDSISTYDLAGALARLQYSTARGHAFSVSREAGVTLSLTGRRRWDLDASSFDGSYTEATVWAAGYHGLRVFGFADHVLAARASALWREGPGAEPHEIGGASGAAQSLLFTSFGSSAGFLPVRGFPEEVRSGTRAWTASLEYRFPVALLDRGLGLWPIHFDRLSGAFFLDAGDAWCEDPFVDCIAAPIAAGPDGDRDDAPLVGAGAELRLDLGLFFGSPFRLRGGVAFPVQADQDREPVYYLRFGRSF